MTDKQHNGNSSSNRLSRPFPANWDAGFKNDSQYRPACNGQEVPVYYGDCGWTLLCWDKKNLKRVLYLYTLDTFVSDIENYI